MMLKKSEGEKVIDYLEEVRRRDNASWRFALAVGVFMIWIIILFGVFA